MHARIGLTGLNSASRKQIFGAQIENNMLDNHADQREMVLLFSLPFFRCCNEQGDHEWFFFSDWQLDGPKEDDKLRYSVFLILLLCRNVGLGVSCGFFQDLSTGLKICSIQMLWTCSGKKTFGLQGKHSILFARLLHWLSSDKTLTSSSQMKRVLIGNDLYLHIRSKPRHLLL